MPKSKLEKKNGTKLRILIYSNLVQLFFHPMLNEFWFQMCYLRKIFQKGAKRSSLSAYITCDTQIAVKAIAKNSAKKKSVMLHKMSAIAP